MPVSAFAQDQPWLADRRYTEGIGYRAGDVELHPGVAVEFGYDTNYLHRSDDYEAPAGSLRLRVTPSLSIETLGPQRREATPGAPPPSLEFRGGVSATYNEFIPVSDDEFQNEVMRSQRDVGGALDLRLTILPQRPWSGSLYAELGRQITPSNAGIDANSFDRVRAGGGGELVFTPGGGLFDWRLGYRFGGTIFESATFDDLTNLEHTAQTRGRWRFMPRTALVFDARLGFISYPQGTDKVSSQPVRAQLGVNGLLTPSFGMLLMAGWGASFYDKPDAEDFDSVIGQLEFKWYLSPNRSPDPATTSRALSALAVGFTREFYDAYIGTYFEQDRGYVNFSYFFGGTFLLVAEAGVAGVVYPPVPELQLNSGWADLKLDGSLFGEYRISDTIGINATARYAHNLSQTTISIAPGQVVDSLQWQQFEAYLGARWFM